MFYQITTIEFVNLRKIKFYKPHFFKTLSRFEEQYLEWLSNNFVSVVISDLSSIQKKKNYLRYSLDFEFKNGIRKNFV